MLRWAKTSPESTASNELSPRQPPAPIFLSGLDNRTRPASQDDRHIQGLYGQNGKVMEF